MARQTLWLGAGFFRRRRHIRDVGRSREENVNRDRARVVTVGICRRSMSLRRPGTGARRPGPYRVDRIDAKLFEWTDEITTDCWREQARSCCRDSARPQGARLAPLEGPVRVRNAPNCFGCRSPRMLPGARAKSRQERTFCVPASESNNVAALEPIEPI